ncbi:MAG: GtrA family protein, partial [Bdellovibrionales bacterium]|nr:GtrA family protein [Bdellovibrionales bacterium]
VYAFTEGLGFTYVVSKLFVSFLVGILFNFPLHRYFVFTVPAPSQKTAPDSGRFAL